MSGQPLKIVIHAFCSSMTVEVPGTPSTWRTFPLPPSALVSFVAYALRPVHVQSAVGGATPCELAELCDETVALPAATSATVQELHMVALHMVCCAVDREVALRDRASASEEVHA